MTDKVSGSWDSGEVTVVTTKKFCDMFRQEHQTDFMIRGLMNIKFCKVERLADAYLGTLAVPSKQSPSGLKQTFGFYLTKEELIFFDDSDTAATIIEEMKESQIMDIYSPVLFLFYFLEHLLRDDIPYLQEYDDRLSNLEELLLHVELKAFDQRIFRVRKELSALCSYYQQLSDVCETLQQNTSEQDDAKDAQLFGLLTGKIDRLYSMIQMMTDYSIQLREMHQTKIDMRQNQIMQTLTIVTTIFMPLSLVAGWYGMNFAVMPELKVSYGYPVVCVICLLIIGLEIFAFKKKKWF